MEKKNGHQRTIKTAQSACKEPSKGPLTTGDVRRGERKKGFRKKRSVKGGKSRCATYWQACIVKKEKGQQWIGEEHARRKDEYRACVGKKKVRRAWRHRKRGTIKAHEEKEKHVLPRYRQEKMGFLVVTLSFGK